VARSFRCFWSPPLTTASKRTPGWHGWLWEVRICEVRAELALARGDWEAARIAATEGIDQSRTYGRRKYEILGLATRAQAVDRLGCRQEAIDDAKLAVAVARSTEDPALLLQTLDLLIQMDRRRQPRGGGARRGIMRSRTIGDNLRVAQHMGPACPRHASARGRDPSNPSYGVP